MEEALPVRMGVSAEPLSVEVLGVLGELRLDELLRLQYWVLPRM